MGLVRLPQCDRDLVVPVTYREPEIDRVDERVARAPCQPGVIVWLLERLYATRLVQQLRKHLGHWLARKHGKHPLARDRVHQALNERAQVLREVVRPLARDDKDGVVTHRAVSARQHEQDVVRAVVDGNPQLLAADVVRRGQRLDRVWEDNVGIRFVLSQRAPDLVRDLGGVAVCVCLGW